MKVNGVVYEYRVTWDEERFITEQDSEFGLPGNYAVMHYIRFCRDAGEVTKLIKEHGNKNNYLIESTFNHEFRLLRIAA